MDAAGWSGEGDFTQRLIDAIAGMAGVKWIKVEDAPASRVDAGFSFISNELFVVFETVPRTVPGRRFGLVPVWRTVHEKRLTLAGLGSRLAVLDEVGEPDYGDQGMLQYLRTQRLVQPYQTRSYKLVELVRIYEGSTRPTGPHANDRKTSG